MIKWLVFLRFLSLSFVINANIIVSPMVVDLTDTQPNTQVAVKNADLKNKAYVEVIPYQLIAPERSLSAKKRVLNPNTAGLLVFPAKLLLLPGQIQYIRVIKTQKKTTVDKVFEIEVLPRVATHLSAKNSNTALGIKLIVGYGVRVTLRPDKPLPQIAISRKNNRLLIQNTGNTNVTINSCTQENSGKVMPISLPFYTLFAGQNRTIALPYASQVTLKAFYMGQSLGVFKTN